MIYKKKPKHFNPRFEVVSCFVECNGEILLLHRLSEKSQGNKWGVPAGKIEPGETPTQAMVREIKEETNLNIRIKDLEDLGKIYVKYPDYDFIYYMFRSQLLEKPLVELNPKEHQNFIWTLPKNAFTMDLMLDLNGCINLAHER